MQIDIQQLSFAFDTTPVLDRITVTPSAGAITAVLGPNAAGKSTLLRCLIGGHRPTSGAVTLDGHDAHRLSPYQIARRIAYVPQRSSVSAAFTVRQVVELGRYVLPPSQKRIEGAIERCELVDVADRPYHTLSVGQQQRVTLARALAQHEPGGALILDEPMSAMDLRHVEHTVRLLQETARRGAAVLIALHDLGLAATIADDAWVLDAGRLVASGGVCDVLTVERLESVFHVPFAWVNDEEGRARLLPGWSRPEHTPTE